MANFEQWINQDLQAPVQAVYSQSLAFSADNDSILVGVHVTDGGEPATLSGNVVAHVIRSADGGTVSFGGTLSGSDVSAILPEACFAYPGQIAVMLQLVSGTTKTTLCKALYSVVQGETGTPIDPGSVVPDLDDLLAMLDEMAQATDAAEAAAAAVPAIIAPTFSSSAAYTAGSYVYYNGALYRFTADHAAGAWTGSDATSVQLAPEVADLKSALDSTNSSHNILLHADVLREDKYYEYTAKSTSTWQGNLPKTRVNVQEGDILTIGIADWHGFGTNVIGFNIYNGSEERLKNWSIVPSDLDENGNYIGQFVMPANAAYAKFEPYVISGGSESPTIGTTYYYRNAILAKGDISLDGAVQVGTSNISDSAVTLTKLQSNLRPYSIGLRYGTKYPNVDTAAQTITFYSGTCIFDAKGTEILRSTEDIVANISNAAQQVRIVFDMDAMTFLALSPTTNIDSARYIALGLITRAGSDKYPIGRGWIGIPHTINGYDPYIKQPNPMWDLPSDWESKVESILEAKGTKFTFAIQTDTHYVLNQDEYFGSNLKALTNRVGFDLVANLGDVIRGYSDEIIDSNENMRAAMTQLMQRYITGISCPLMIAMGNHDRNTAWANAYAGTPFTFAEVWGRMFKPSFNTMPNVATQTGIMYYYMDFDDVRVIVLNTQDGNNGSFGVGAEQQSWFTNVALDTNKIVLVMSHVPLVNGWSVSSNYDSSFANIVTSLHSFKSNGGRVIGCMSGHTHTQEDKTVDDILYITFRNGAGLCEVVQVDIANKTINTIPVGFTGVGNRSFTFT